MTDKSPAPTGVGTLQALSGALGVATFTVRSLASRAGVTEDTVEDLLRRYPHFFERAGSIRGSGRGRPPNTWQIRASAIDEVAAEAGRLVPAAAMSQPAHVGVPADLAEASLTMAGQALLQVDPADPVSARDFLSAARSSLSAAGIDRGILDHEGFDPGSLQASIQARRGRLLHAVADVIEAELDGESEQVAATQALAFRVLGLRRYELSLVTQWLAEGRPVAASGAGRPAGPAARSDLSRAAPPEEVWAKELFVIQRSPAAAGSIPRASAIAGSHTGSRTTGLLPPIEILFNKVAQPAAPQSVGPADASWLVDRPSSAENTAGERRAAPGEPPTKHVEAGASILMPSGREVGDEQDVLAHHAFVAARELAAIAV